MTDRDYAVQAARVEPVSTADSSLSLLGTAAASSKESAVPQAVDYSSVDAFFESFFRKDKPSRAAR
jgi:hypothetical protein